jgi:hypothetical protein
VSVVPTLEDMAKKIAEARERLSKAERKVEEKKAPYFAAVGDAASIRQEVEAMEQAMESSKRAHMTLRAVEDASLTYDGPLVVPVEVYRGYDMYFLGDFGDGSGAMKPLPPPEGGRWKWLKVREQEALEAA